MKKQKLKHWATGMHWSCPRGSPMPRNSKRAPHCHQLGVTCSTEAGNEHCGPQSWGTMGDAAAILGHPEVIYYSHLLRRAFTMCQALCDIISPQHQAG